MCLTQFPTCTPNLTIFPQVSGLKSPPDVLVVFLTASEV